MTKRPTTVAFPPSSSSWLLLSPACIWATFAALLITAPSASSSPLASREVDNVAGHLGAASEAMAGARSKRAPFSSWAGKRSSGTMQHHMDVNQLLHDLQEARMLQDAEDATEDAAEDAEMPLQKRAPFSSWAGKRAPFSSWAGKRAPFSSWAGKRAPFSSWAGKRSSHFDSAAAVEAANDLLNGGVRHRFKRSSGEEVAEENNRLGERSVRSFSTWGGKRNLLRRFTRNAPNDVLQPVRVMRPQRAAFSAWGG